jgi:hypothetical protein
MNIPHYISEEAALLVCAGFSNTMITGDTLNSNSNNTVGDFIISKNRTAIALLKRDGNFVIYTGQFTTKGEPVGKITSIWDLKNFTSSNPFFTKAGYNNFILTLRDGLFLYTEDKSNILEIFKKPNNAAGVEMLEINDSGNLIYTLNGIPTWTLFPINQQNTSASSVNNTMTSPMSLNNYLLPIGAALAGLYFFFK